MQARRFAHQSKNSKLKQPAQAAAYLAGLVALNFVGNHAANTFGFTAGAVLSHVSQVDKCFLHWQPHSCAVAGTRVPHIPSVARHHVPPVVPVVLSPVCSTPPVLQAIWEALPPAP